MKLHRVGAVLSILTTFAITACGGGGSAASGGPIDGTWKLSSLTCNGTPQQLAGFVFSISNATGSLVETFSATCVATVNETYTYPSASAFSMAPQSIACNPSSGCGSLFGGQNCPPIPPKLDYTYTLSGSTLTFTRISAGNEPCPAGQTAVFVGTAM